MLRGGGLMSRAVMVKWVLWVRRADIMAVPRKPQPPVMRMFIGSIAESEVSCQVEVVAKKECYDGVLERCGLVAFVCMLGDC